MRGATGRRAEQKTAAGDKVMKKGRNNVMIQIPSPS